MANPFPSVTTDAASAQYARHLLGWLVVAKAPRINVVGNALHITLAGEDVSRLAVAVDARLTNHGALSALLAPCPVWAMQLGTVSMLGEHHTANPAMCLQCGQFVAKMACATCTASQHGVVSLQYAAETFARKVARVFQQLVARCMVSHFAPVILGQPITTMAATKPNLAFRCTTVNDASVRFEVWYATHGSPKAVFTICSHAGLPQFEMVVDHPRDAGLYVVLPHQGTPPLQLTTAGTAFASHDVLGHAFGVYMHSTRLYSMHILRQYTDLDPQHALTRMCAGRLDVRRSGQQLTGLLWRTAKGCTVGDDQFRLQGILRRPRQGNMSLRHVCHGPSETANGVPLMGNTDPNLVAGARLKLLQWSAVLTFIMHHLRDYAVPGYNTAAFDSLATKTTEFDVGVLPPDGRHGCARHVSVPGWQGYLLNVSQFADADLGTLFGVAGHEASHMVYVEHDKLFANMVTCVMAATNTALLYDGGAIARYVELYCEVCLRLPAATVDRRSGPFLYDAPATVDALLDAPDALRRGLPALLAQPSTTCAVAAAHTGAPTAERPPTRAAAQTTTRTSSLAAGKAARRRVKRDVKRVSPVAL